MQNNPYQASSVDMSAKSFGGVQELATRGSRLAASFLNGLLLIPGYIPLGFGVAGMVSSAAATRAEMTPEMLESGAAALPSMNPLPIIIAVVYFIVLAVLQLMKLAKTGQTFGKKWMGIKVVRNDGSPATLGRSFGMREVLNIVIGIIPLLGPIYSIVDILCIFGADQRCLHDKIADTMVVKA
jgi:uncharacterized RDD family membrane protein YckC